MSESDRRYAEWYLSGRNHGRRDKARVTSPEVISSSCSGTTLVQVVLHPKGVIEVTETPNSESCGFIPSNLVTEAGDQVTAENGDHIVTE